MSLCSSTRGIWRLSQLEAKARWGWVLTGHSSCSKWDKRHPEPSSGCSGQWLSEHWGVCQMRVCSPLSSCILGSRKIHSALPGSVLSLSPEQWLDRRVDPNKNFSHWNYTSGLTGMFCEFMLIKEVCFNWEGKKKKKSSRKMGQGFWKKM